MSAPDPAVPAFDARALRDALGHFATGVAVVTAPGLLPGGDPVGITINSFAAISLEPPLVLFGAARSLKSLSALMAARHFGISLLAGDQEALSTRFATSQSRKWDGVTAHAGSGQGYPLLADGLGHFECVPHATFDGGDHLIFLVRVVRFRMDGTRAPLIFFRGAYRRLEQPALAETAS